MPLIIATLLWLNLLSPLGIVEKTDYPAAPTMKVIELAIVLGKITLLKPKKQRKEPWTGTIHLEVGNSSLTIEKKFDTIEPQFSKTGYIQE